MPTAEAPGSQSSSARPPVAQTANKQIGGQTVSRGANSDGVVVIGKGTKITGQISDCAKLEIQGTVEGDVAADALVIHEGGVIIGDVRASQAEIHGAFQGKLIVQNLLDVRATGQVEGELAYGKLAVAMGGHVSGKLNGEIDQARSTAAPTAAQATVITMAAPAVVPTNLPTNLNGREWLGQAQQVQ